MGVVRLVGRQLELGELEGERRRASKGEFRCVLLTGDPGIGKTRLAGELLARCRQSAVCLSARAYPLGATSSFGLWAEVLERHFRGLSPDDVTELCDGVLDDLASLLRGVAAVAGSRTGGQPSRAQLLEGLTVVIGNLGRRAQVVVVFDDAHQADASSWETLSHLARNLPEAPLLIVLAARSGELAEHTAATSVLLDLEKEGRLRRIELCPLGSAEIAELAGAVLDEPPSGALAAWLTERSQGQPLFALGLLDALLQEGADLSAPQLDVLPEALSERVGAQLLSLDEPALATLEALAVLGRRAGSLELSVLTHRTHERLSAIIDQLVRLRLVVEDVQVDDLAYVIAHPVVSEAVYERIGKARRRALHRLIARSVLKSGRLGEAAAHFARSAAVGDAEAIDALLAAVREAEARQTYREALVLLASLVDLIPTADKRWLEVADAMSWQQEWVAEHPADLAAAGIRAMREVGALFNEEPDTTRRAKVASRLAGFLAWGTGDLAEAEAVLLEAIRLFGEEGSESEALVGRAELALVQGMKGDATGMWEQASEIRATAEAVRDPAAMMAALITEGVAGFSLGRFSAAEEALEQAVLMARPMGGPLLRTCLLTLALSLGFEGRREDALSLFEEAKSVDPGWREGPVLQWEAFVRWVCGDVTGALTAVRETPRMAGQVSKRQGIGMVIGALAAVEAALSAEARDFLSAANRAYAGRDWFFFQDYALYATGLVAWHEGRAQDCFDCLGVVASKLLVRELRPYAAHVLADLAEVSAELGETSTAAEASHQLAELAQHIGRDRYDVLAGLARCWAAVGAGAAPKDAEGLRELAFAAATDSPVLAARLLDVVARILGDTDRPGARALLMEAAAIFASCGAEWRRQRTLEVFVQFGGAVRRSAKTAPRYGELTYREREVARLAAEGRSARAIADTLGIGQRTVETHLGHVYAKLGVESKLDLVRRGVELGLL